MAKCIRARPRSVYSDRMGIFLFRAEIDGSRHASPGARQSGYASGLRIKGSQSLCGGMSMAIAIPWSPIPARWITFLS